MNNIRDVFNAVLQNLLADYGRIMTAFCVNNGVCCVTDGCNSDPGVTTGSKPVVTDSVSQLDLTRSGAIQLSMNLFLIAILFILFYLFCNSSKKPLRATRGGLSNEPIK